MSHFYGSIQGNRGGATRAGSYSYTAWAQNHHTRVSVNLYRHDDDRDRDSAGIYFGNGHSNYGDNEFSIAIPDLDAFYDELQNDASRNTLKRAFETVNRRAAKHC